MPKLADMLDINKEGLEPVVPRGGGFMPPTPPITFDPYPTVTTVRCPLPPVNPAASDNVRIFLGARMGLPLRGRFLPPVKMK